jgi:hypothetical protein
MSRQLQYSPLPVDNIKDPVTRDAVRHLDDMLAGVYAILREMIATDVSSGRVAVKAPILPRSVDADPTAQSTFGEPGEVVRFGSAWYRKLETLGIDTNWELMT